MFIVFVERRAVKLVDKLDDADDNALSVLHRHTQDTLRTETISINLRTHPHTHTNTYKVCSNMTKGQMKLTYATMPEFDYIRVLIHYAPDTSLKIYT